MGNEVDSTGGATMTTTNGTEKDILEQVAGMVDANFRSAQDAYDEHAAEQAGGAAAESGPRFQRLTMAQVLAMPPKEWMIDQILGHGDLVMMYGAPGSGKTFVALDLAIAAALGRPFAGRFEMARPLTVAYAAGEGGSGLAQRLQAAAAYYDVEDIPNLHIYMTAPQLYDVKDPCSAARFIDEYAAAQSTGDVAPLDLLILDTLHSVTAGADENSSQHMGQVLRQTKAINDRLGCSVLLPHHTNKNGTAERGSSALRGAMDCMIEVKEVGSSRLMTCEKLKDGEAWKPQTFDLIAKDDSARVEWGTVGSTGKNDATPAKLVAVLRDNIGVRFTAKSLAEAVGAKPIATTTALNRLTEKGEVNRDLEDKSKTNSNRNPWVYWVENSS